MKHYHYYIHSNWSIIRTDDPIGEDDVRGWSESAQPANGFRDDEVRYQLTLEEVAEYLRDPIKFVFENELATFRDGKIMECEAEEILDAMFNRYSKFDEPDIPVLSDDSWCWYPLRDGTWSNINHDITFESWAELHEADLWERLQVPRYIRTELRETAGLGEMLSRMPAPIIGAMELTDSQQNENLIEYFTYHLIEGDTTGEELYSVNMQAFVHEYCWASDPEMGNCIVLSDACLPEYNNLVDAINAYIDWHKFSKLIRKED